jgi:hypothetical protein
MGDLSKSENRIRNRSYKSYTKWIGTLVEKSDGIIVLLMTRTTQPCRREGSLLSVRIASEVSVGA